MGVTAKGNSDNYTNGSVVLGLHEELCIDVSYCRNRTCIELHDKVIILDHYYENKFGIYVYRAYCIKHFRDLLKRRYLFMPESYFKDVYKVVMSKKYE